MSSSTTANPAARIDRLSDVSARQFREPEQEFEWSTMSPGRVLPDDLLSIAGLDLDLDDAARARLSREEVAAMLASGIRFEAILNTVFSSELAHADDLDDPSFVYMLHEVGEETRHQRAFLRLRGELAPTARNPFDNAVIGKVLRHVARLLERNHALFSVLLLAGEEIPDLIQKRASEHPDTDPLLRAVNRYHRAEEARHLAFARLTLRERWNAAGRVERFRVRYAAPFLIRTLFENMVHPGVYKVVGLPGMETWRAAHRTPQRVALRHEATRSVLRALCDAGVFEPGHIPSPWQRLCGVDAHGMPVEAPAAA